MVAELNSLIAEFVQIVPSSKARAAGTDGMVIAEEERPMAEKMLGPIAHQEAARALTDAIGRHL